MTEDPEHKYHRRTASPITVVFCLVAALVLTFMIVYEVSNTFIVSDSMEDVSTGMWGFAILAGAIMLALTRLAYYLYSVIQGNKPPDDKQ
jgi:hypothetical protein